MLSKYHRSIGVDVIYAQICSIEVPSQNPRHDGPCKYNTRIKWYVTYGNMVKIINKQGVIMYVIYRYIYYILDIIELVFF